MSEKHDAFVRLSEKRLENIEDAIRIWSNLSGPSYEFQPREIYAGLERIQAAVVTAYERFQGSKSWSYLRETPLTAPEMAVLEAVSEAESPSAPDEPPQPADPGITPRQAEMLRIWDEAGSEQGALVEMLAMQQEVINHLQSLLNAKGST